MDHSCDRVAELGFFVADAVAANHCASGFDHFGKTAGEDAFEDFKIDLVGKTDQGQRGEGTASHGVDVGECVGSGDLAEGVGIVNDRGEEVYSLYKRLLGRELIPPGVVGLVEAY